MVLVHRPRTNNVLAMYWVSTSPLAPSVKGLQAGVVGAKDRVGVLEMSSAMIRSRAQVLEEVMEINPPVMDLSGEDSTDSKYADVDDGGAMLVDNLEDERDQENVVPIPVPPPVIRINTPHPPTIL
jgi:hypothetical protein